MYPRDHDLVSPRHLLLAIRRRSNNYLAPVQVESVHHLAERVDDNIAHMPVMYGDGQEAEVMYSGFMTDAGEVSRYAIIFSNTKQFQLVVQYLAAGLSFRQVAQVMLDTKELLGIRSIESCYDGIVSRYTCFICLMNLQCIVELLQKVGVLCRA